MYCQEAQWIEKEMEEKNQALQEKVLVLIFFISTNLRNPLLLLGITDQMPDDSVRP